MNPFCFVNVLEQARRRTMENIDTVASQWAAAVYAEVVRATAWLGVDVCR